MIKFDVYWNKSIQGMNEFVLKTQIRALIVTNLNLVYLSVCTLKQGELKCYIKI